MLRLTKKTLLRVTAATLLACPLAMITPAPVLAAESARPALTPEMADRATNYMEWLLDARFTADQRQQYRQSVVDTFRSRNQAAIDGLMSMIQAETKMESMSEAERASKREKIQPQFLALLRADPKAEGTSWLLGIYEAAHSGASQQAAVPVRNVSAGSVSGELLGKWGTGRISTIQYKNSVTGVAAPTSGSRFQYEFKPDGTYDYTGLIQTTMYNCTNATFAHETGTYSVQNGVVAIRPQNNPYQMTNSCAPSSNKTAPGKLINKDYRFRISQENGRATLELIGADGSSSTFRRE